MIKLVVFDAYGTLFDVNSVVQACEAAYPGKGAIISRTWRQKQLEYTWLRALMERYEDFEVVTQDALRFALRQLKLPQTAKTIETLTSSYLTLNCFPEVTEALKVFQPRQLLILSNGTEHMLHTLVENVGLKPYFSAILSVEGLRTYKPNPEVYDSVLTRFGIPKQEILFVSSNGWDIAGAKSFGFTVGWVNRQGNTTEELGLKPDYEVNDLLELDQSIRLLD